MTLPVRIPLGLVLVLAILAALPAPEGRAGDEVAALLAAGEVERAVASATDREALLAATLAQEPAVVAAVVREVVALRGPFHDPAVAARWLLDLAERRGGDAETLAAAGYVWLASEMPSEALAPLERAREAGAGGWAGALLADAYRRAQRYDEAASVLREAAGREDAPRRYVEDIAVALATRLRIASDVRYADLLVDLGLPLVATTWLVEDADLEGDANVALAWRRRACQALAAATLANAPPALVAQVARFAEGEERTAWLVDAVRRGRDPQDPSRHACPDALLLLARLCAERGRLVAAAALARERLALGESPAAWDLLESLPPDLP